jgi:mannose-6-phosphate isomerase-like protein (cupin superfamily)
MIIANLKDTPGRTYPARRLTRNLVGGASPVQCENFCMGIVTLDAGGGQVPWHNQEQEEVYTILSGEGEMCLGSERVIMGTGETVYIPPTVFHQLTNIGSEPLTYISRNGPAGYEAHWRQEMAGTVPRAGLEAPALPEGAHPQCTEKPLT